MKTSSGSRLDRAYLIKELDGTYVMAHQREAPTSTTELLGSPFWDSNLQPLGQ